MSDNTTIQYYIPEDGDDLEHPNVVMMKKKASSITLGDIRDVRKWILLLTMQMFPIPGTYYFRFKRAFKKTWSSCMVTL